MNTPYTVPRIAIISPDTLAAMGLRQLLQATVPALECDIMETAETLFAEGGGERYVHFFVATSVFLAHRSYFTDHKRKTILLAGRADGHVALPSDFNTIVTTGSERDVTRRLLQLFSKGHPHGHGTPAGADDAGREASEVLSGRETEVLALVARGLLNKQIADRLSIGIATVITHRRNIVEKLGLRSVPALTIYAVMHGLVDINDI